MSKSNQQFVKYLKSLSPKKLIIAYSLFLMTFLYPGHNKLQTTIIKPGIPFDTTLPDVNLAPYPVSDGTAIPGVTANSYLIQDLSSKTIIASRLPDLALAPASITKLMTALVALDTWSDLNTVLTVKNSIPTIGQSIDLTQGEQLTVSTLLQALLIHSGNDAALTIADNYCASAPQSPKGADCGYTAFVQAMNKKATELHLSHTMYKNPSGIDQYGHATTARDIARLATIALVNPTIKEIVAMDEAIITDVTGKIKHYLKSTDELLTELPGLQGGKTGWTTGAGECFVSYVDRGGRGIVTVVLGSTDRFDDTTRLVEWVYAHHTWEKVDSPR